jgi:hypothetical protein
MTSLFIDYPQPFGSFRWPVDPPGIDPYSEPRVCVSFNETWLPYILGCLLQLQLPTTWCNSTDADKIVVIKQAEKLFDLFQNHYICTWQHTFDFSIDCYEDVWGPPPSSSGWGAHCDLADTPGWHGLVSDCDVTSPDFFPIGFDIHTVDPISADATIDRVEVSGSSDVGGFLLVSFCPGIVPTVMDCDTFITQPFGDVDVNDLNIVSPHVGWYLHFQGPPQCETGTVAISKIVVVGRGTDPWPLSPL